MICVQRGKHIRHIVADKTKYNDILIRNVNHSSTFFVSLCIDYFPSFPVLTQQDIPFIQFDHEKFFTAINRKVPGIKQPEFNENKKNTGNRPKFI